MPTEHRHDFSPLPQRVHIDGVRGLMQIRCGNGCSKTKNSGVMRCPDCGPLRRNYANAMVSERVDCALCGGYGYTLADRRRPKCCCGMRGKVVMCDNCVHSRGSTLIHCCTRTTDDDNDYIDDLDALRVVRRARLSSDAALALEQPTQLGGPRLRD